MKGRDFPIFPILLMGLMAVIAYWMYKNVYFEEVEFDVRQSEEARKNQFLVGSRLLEKEGFSFGIAKDRSVFSSLDNERPGVLWLADLSVLANQDEADDIHEWVQSGGILLTSPRDKGAFSDSIVSSTYLSKIGISELNDDELAVAQSQHEQTMYEGDDYYHVDLQDSTLQSSKIALYTDVIPYFKSIATSDSDIEVIIDTPYLVHKKIGDGYVVIYNDHTMFDNDSIRYDEHGYLLLWLTQPAQTKTLSIVIQPAEKPGWFRFLWNRFALSILLLGVVLTGFIRWASTRLGPVEQELPPIQNNLMAHLAARGEYWHRHNHTAEIVANVQSAAIENLLKRQGKPGVEQVGESIDRAEAIKQASDLLQCSPATAEHALFGTVKKNAAIISASRTLQKINYRKPFKPQ